MRRDMRRAEGAILNRTAGNFVTRTIIEKKEKRKRGKYVSVIKTGRQSKKGRVSYGARHYSNAGIYECGNGSGY